MVVRPPPPGADVPFMGHHRLGLDAAGNRITHGGACIFSCAEWRFGDKALGESETDMYHKFYHKDYPNRPFWFKQKDEYRNPASLRSWLRAFFTNNLKVRYERERAAEAVGATTAKR